MVIREDGMMMWVGKNHVLWLCCVSGCHEPAGGVIAEANPLSNIGQGGLKTGGAKKGSRATYRERD